MPFAKLKKLAQKHGYKIGKDGPGEYWYMWSKKGRNFYRDFEGSLEDFERFVTKDLCKGTT